MKSKGFVLFFGWLGMICCLRRKDLYEKSFKGEKLQVNKISFDSKER